MISAIGTGHAQQTTSLNAWESFKNSAFVQKVSQVAMQIFNAIKNLCKNHPIAVVSSVVVLTLGIVAIVKREKVKEVAQKLTTKVKSFFKKKDAPKMLKTGDTTPGGSVIKTGEYKNGEKVVTVKS
tara:strand:- start:267 stop:644 length:378 start_codon:yes stop_codon:yes gene_type:complete